MKKLIVGLAGFLMTLGLGAQSVDVGNRQLYYEQYNNAEATFQNLVQQQPANAAAWQGLVKAHLAQGEVAEAMQKIQQAPAGIQQEPWFLVAKGTALMANGDKAAAAPLFQQAISKTREKDAGILAAVAEAHVITDAGDANHAVALMHKAIKRDKKNPYMHVMLGHAYRKAGNSSEAYKSYKQAIDYDENYAAAYHHIADIFLSQKNEDMYMQYFDEALTADQNFAPTLQKMYVYYFYKDPARALDYYNRYMVNADSHDERLYDLADLYYINKKYDEAIAKANAIVTEKGEEVKPRIYKLIGYSYAALEDSAKALAYMDKYFDQSEDSSLLAKDFEMMGELQLAAGNQEEAVDYLTKATERGDEDIDLYPTYKRLAAIAEANKDFVAQAKWMGKYYTDNDKATNVDLFKWALAHYRAEEYLKAAEVFTEYTNQYPDQSYGFYWLARSYAAQDSEMEEGLAVPHYKKLLEVLQQDTENPNYKNWAVEAYGFLAAYQANQEKNYAEAINYFQKVLELDPANDEARKYIDILEKAEAGG